MIIDSSAMIAILRQEPDAARFAEQMSFAAVRILAAPTYIETCIVYCGRKGPESRSRVDAFIQASGIEIKPFTGASATIAVQAYLTYGKGRGHPAQLNFGDCISYAASKVEAMPLLFKGNDFRLTDVEVAL